MRCSWLLILGFVLNVAHCLEILGLDRDPNLEVSRNVTAVLGEAVHLTCRYLGQSQIQSAVWKRRSNSQSKSKRLAGFSQGQAFGRDEFSTPHSLTNLTVKVDVSRVGVEGEYVCEFESEEEDFFASVFVNVVARPHIQILVDAETINDTHYQVVSCSAVGGRPTPQISWLVGGLPPSDNFFTVNVTETHSNGTSTLSSVLSFPTHLQDENIVTCVVQHPTLPQPELTTAVVEIYKCTRMYTC
ncbi:poliovirus receptor-like [Acanthochromis polyacanthus]|uniref:poliovirus receptor-like n=1 Tax=Acanthochromis polyacanthus TaxID=80966 RepID=UPI0022340BC9|nr:poliovirus receptor-like [Acanthochromis polyacanthus]